MVSIPVLISKSTGFLKEVAENHPAIGRFLEIGFFAGATYVLTALAQGEILNKEALIVAVASALLPALSKKGRDSQK